MLFYFNRATSKYMGMLLKWETRQKKKGKFAGLRLKQLQGRMKDASEWCTAIPQNEANDVKLLSRLSVIQAIMSILSYITRMTLM